MENKDSDEMATVDGSKWIDKEIQKENAENPQKNIGKEKISSSVQKEEKDVETEENSSNDNKTKTAKNDTENKPITLSTFKDFIMAEFSRNYQLENDANYYQARREQMHDFVRIPMELEEYMIFGLLQCLDSIIYVFTFLLVRVIRAYCKLLIGILAKCFFRLHEQRILLPSEHYDLLKYTYFILCCSIVIYVDTNYLYHIIKSQSMFKLYMFYNMLEIGERVLSIFGQYPMDALHYTATKAKTVNSSCMSSIFYNLFAIIYMILHCAFVTVQATTISVAVNSSQQELLMIMMSNNFNKLKRSLFKKYTKNGLQHLTCADVRDRFHLTTLILITFGITMKELNWDIDNFYFVMQDCWIVLIAGILLDWIKHAFINCFNGYTGKIYQGFMLDLAKDILMSKNENAFSDHSDVVARYLGFTPFPLAVMIVKAFYTTFPFRNITVYIMFLLFFILMVLLRILIMIFTLSKTDDLLRNCAKGEN